MCRVVQQIFHDGERYPILINEQSVPLFWPTLYVTVHLRVNAQNTISNHLYSINHLLLWEMINNRDLTQEFKCGIFLQKDDVASLKGFCSQTVRSAKSSLNRAPLSVRHINNGWSGKNQPILNTVDVGHQRRRLNDISRYLDFLARTVLAKDAKLNSLVDDIEKMQRLFKYYAPKGTSKSEKSINEVSAESEVFEEFMQVVKIRSPDNRSFSR